MFSAATAHEAREGAMLNAQDLLGEVMRAGMSAGSRRGVTTSRRVERALGPQGVGGQGGFLEQIMGGQTGAGGGLGGLLGGVSAGLGKAGERVKAGDPLAIGALGAIAGALFGRSKSTVGNAVGGGALALLGTLAYSALQGMGGAARGEDRIATEEDLPVGVRPPRTPGEQAVLSSKALILLQAMISAAKADGQIEGGELERILGRLEKGGADSEARDFLLHEMRRPPDLDGLVAQVSDPELAAEVYAASLLAIEVDTPAEKAYLERLATALGVDPAVRRHLHATLGAPAPD
jgi:uncharacterized membrane protein YebE (DUF533 family)